MKKFLYICSTIILTLCMGVFCGCDIINNRMYKENYGALTWVTTKVDEGTRIYANGDLVESFPQDKNAYILRLDKGTYDIEIKGFKGEKEIRTAKFQYVVPSLTETRYTSSEEFAADQDRRDEYFFYQSQHLILDYRGTGISSDSISARINIAKTVKKVSILSDKRMNLNASFLILKRDDDIEFELENIHLTGLRNSKYVIDYDGDEVESVGEGLLVIKAFGSTNSIASKYSASDGVNGENGQGIVHATSGTPGEKGGGAIRANKLLLISEKDFAVSAYNGGNGGNGGEKGSITVSGYGGNGGDGGDAISCDTIQLFILDGKFNAVGGKGGKGGRGGTGKSDGSSGSEGVGVRANTKTELFGSFE